MGSILDFIKIFKDSLTQPVPLGACILLMILETLFFVIIFREIRKNHKSAFDSQERVNANLIRSMENKDARISELEGSLHAVNHQNRDVNGGNSNGNN